MNKRIRELAEQARVQDRGYFIYQYGGTTGHQSIEKAIDLEKFAELIVRECMALCKTSVGNADYNTGRLHCLENIKEHFGVDK